MYRIAVDVGGTFTDLVAALDGGGVVEAKVPSNREHPEAALEAGLEELARRTGCEGVEELLARTRIVIQGTTVAVNAVLQAKGAKTGLICTDGFRDTLEIRLGYKDERYVFPYSNPPALVPRSLRISVTERVDKSGRPTVPLAEHEVAEAARRLAAEGVEAVAICFLWSFLHPEHERRAEEIVREVLPGAFVTRSSVVLPRIREYDRTSTTVLNAYVGPIVERFVARTEERLRSLGFAGRIRYVQSNGGLAEAAEVTRRPVLLLVSGPAAGPAAGLQFASLAGRNFIVIDMGGTSFDACLVRDGLPDMRGTSEIDRYRIATPLIDVHTIGAGGGSIASVEERLLRVGPESAEARPGPACYRFGGVRATVTDANVVVGLLNQTALLGGRFPIDAALAHDVVRETVAEQLELEPQAAAAGIVEVVSRSMADAIREITVRRGHDPRDYALVVGGGAGGLHAAQLAEELGIRRVVVPRIASALCAFGAVVADIRHDYTRTYAESTRSLDFAAVAAVLEELEGEGRRALADEGSDEAGMRFLRSLDLRYNGQVYEVAVDISDLDLRGDPGVALEAVESRFHARHHGLYDYSQPGYPCELIAVTVTALGLSPALTLPARSGGGAQGAAPAPASRRFVRFDRAQPAVDTPVYAGAAFDSDQALGSPALIEEPNTTIAVPPGWQVTFHEREQAYVLEPAGAR